MNKKNKLTPLERSWILYDIGNSAYILLVATLLPIYFKALMPVWSSTMLCCRKLPSTSGWTRSPP